MSNNKEWRPMDYEVYNYDGDCCDHLSEAEKRGLGRLMKDTEGEMCVHIHPKYDMDGFLMRAYRQVRENKGDKLVSMKKVEYGNHPLQYYREWVFENKDHIPPGTEFERKFATTYAYPVEMDDDGWYRVRNEVDYI